MEEAANAAMAAYGGDAEDKEAEDKSDSESDSETEAAKPQHRTKLDRMFAKKNQSVVWEHYGKIKESEDAPAAGDMDDGEDDGFMKIARKDHDLENVPTMAPKFLERPLSVRDKRNMKIKQRVLKDAGNATKIRFDDDGTVRPISILMELIFCMCVCSLT